MIIIFVTNGNQSYKLLIHVLYKEMISLIINDICFYCYQSGIVINIVTILVQNAYTIINPFTHIWYCNL